MISGTISPENYLSAQHLHRRKTVQRNIAIAASMIAAGIAFLFFSQLIIGVGLIGGGIGCGIGELILAKVVLPRKARRTFSQQKDLAEVFTYSWNSEFIVARSAIGESKRPWKNYSKYAENAHIFLLYHADNLFEMFPKTWFQSQEQLDDFRAKASLARS